MEQVIKHSAQKADWIKNNFDVFLETIQERLPIFENLAVRCNFQGEILEIGAGSAWLSALISKMPGVRKVYALDISEKLLKEVAGRVISSLAGDKNKIELVVADFNNLPFGDSRFDAVVCDASLHHAADLARLLKEIKRVLKKDGFIAAVREPVRAVFNFRDFGKKEKEQGAIENIYSFAEWKTYFNQAGFELDIIEDFSQNDAKTKLLRQIPLRYFNGILFSRYHFWAKRCAPPEREEF
jgi:ubiquinone/menaquinone biosynthesis C-methylase UbiE